jgi:hypothetical protein
MRSSIAIILCATATAALVGCGAGSSKMTELQRVKSGGLDIVLLSPDNALTHGTDTFVLEFRSNGQLVDAGTVRASATMPMPGMPMFGALEVRPADVPGRYAVTSKLDMAGTWRATVEWEGAAGKGSVSFSAPVQ